VAQVGHGVHLIEGGKEAEINPQTRFPDKQMAPRKLPTSIILPREGAGKGCLLLLLASNRAGWRGQAGRGQARRPFFPLGNFKEGAKCSLSRNSIPRFGGEKERRRFARGRQVGLGWGKTSPSFCILMRRFPSLLSLLSFLPPFLHFFSFFHVAANHEKSFPQEPFSSAAPHSPRPILKRLAWQGEASLCSRLARSRGNWGRRRRCCI